MSGCQWRKNAGIFVMRQRIIRQPRELTGMQSRETISVNTKRKLWAGCAGYCQNPGCNKYLFKDVDDESVSIANMAHIIGAGKNGPRSEHELADYIDKSGIDNLIMLCLDCHKIIDELEKKFGVEQLRLWKAEHSRKLAALFSIPTYTSERDLLIEIDRLLEENKTIFETYGPFSDLAVSGPGGDSKKVWKRRCLDTILPNNERIVRLMEKHKNSFGYPWDIYRGFLDFQVHATSFRENCLFEDKVNDYRTFPTGFPILIKTALRLPVDQDSHKDGEGIEYRTGEIRKLIERFLSDHSGIAKMEEMSRGVFIVEKKNGTRLRVFVTHTYFFTEYTYDKVLSEDPNISAIICSSPYASYTDSAKERCIADEVGLFTLPEFMGAVNFEGDKFLNFLLSEDRKARARIFEERLAKFDFLKGYEAYLFGSFLRRSIFRDIDLLLVYPNGTSISDVDSVVAKLRTSLPKFAAKLHIETCSKKELPQLKMNFDNRVKVY